MIVEQVRRQIEQELQATQTEIERLDELLKLKGDYGLGRGDPTVYSAALPIATLCIACAHHEAQLQLSTAIESMRDVRL
jgi:hypothetical protein